MKKRMELSGIPIDSLTKEQIICNIAEWFKESGPSRHIVTLNALMLMAAQDDQSLALAIREADLVIADGYGIDAALKRKKHELPCRLPGVELAQILLAFSGAQGYSVCFYGDSPQVAARLREMIPEKWPGIVINSIWDGFTSLNIRDKIIAKPPDLLLVGLGTPSQEIFLNSLLTILPHTIGIGVGGSFQVIAEIKSEAPMFIRENGWEWLFRILQEPRRIKRIPQLVKFWYQFLK